jgi:hypothetical protein
MIAKNQMMTGIAAATSAWLLSAATSSAGLLAYEGFDYNAGVIFNDTQNGGTGWAAGDVWDVSSTTRMEVTTTGLSYLNLQVSGRALKNNSTSGVDAVRTIANAPTTDSVFFSFLVNGDTNTKGRFGALIRPEDNTAGPGVVGLSTVDSLGGAGADGRFGLRTNQANLGGLNGSNEAGSSQVGTNLVVVQYNYTTNQASFWVNPTALGGTAPTPTNSGITFTTPTQTVQEFLFGYQDANSTSAIFDEIRVGTTYASVTPIPEPAALSLLGLAAVPMMARRRRI